MTADNQRAFLQIAARAATEDVNAYTVMCLGLQSYLVAARVGGTRVDV